MARENASDDLPEDLDEPGDDWEPDEGDVEALDDLEDLEDLDDVDLDEDGDFEDEDGDEDESEDEGAEALDELEAEELEMLTEDEEAESLPIDEAAEMRQIRRESMALDTTPESAGEGEFVCTNCFLVKRVSQMKDRRKRLCRDCA